MEREQFLELVTETLGASYLRHGPDGTMSVTAEQHRETVARMRKDMPDLHLKPEDEAITEDKWWCRWSISGTDSKTGEPFTTAALQSYRTADGRIVETWLATNGAGSSWDG